MCKKIMRFEEHKGKWVYKTKNINNTFGWLVKAETNLGYKKGLYIQDALKPSGITYVKTVLIVNVKNLKFVFKSSQYKQSCFKIYTIHISHSLSNLINAH